jgi:flagellar protein FlaI
MILKPADLSSNTKFLPDYFLKSNATGRRTLRFCQHNRKQGNEILLCCRAHTKTYEKTVLERVRNNLEDVLTQEDMIAGKEKDVILINRAMRLFDQYYSTLEVSSIHKIMYFLRRNFIGYERINPLIRDPNIEDISCSGIEIPIYLYHRKHNNIVTNIRFGEKELDSLVVKLCQRSGKHISIGEPIVDATLPDGSRIQATLGKEVTTRGSSYTIRKFKGDPITPVDLMRYGTCSIEMMAYYWIAIENNISVLFAGRYCFG